MPTILLILLIWVDRVVLVTGMTQPGEMRQFFGLLFLMGIVHKPCLDLFWSKDVLYSTPTFNAIMSCNRFQLMLKFLHFNDIAIMAPATSRDLSLTTCLRGSRNCTHQPKMLLLMNLCFFGREGRLSSNTYSWKDFWHQNVYVGRRQWIHLSLQDLYSLRECRACIARVVSLWKSSGWSYAPFFRSGLSFAY